MLKSLSVVNLNARMTFNLEFHDDINIVTGKNGSGKTTVLKLLWYAISGNLERILPEITFDSFELITDTLTVGMTMEITQKRKMVKLKYSTADIDKEASIPFERAIDWRELQEANRAIQRASGSSIFFPTFRRIEGGFSIAGRADDNSVRRTITGKSGRWNSSEVFFTTELGGLKQAIDSLSDRMSVGAHRFVASISTDDIQRLLTSKYAEIYETTNRLHMNLSRFILTRVGDISPSASGTESAEEQREPREALDNIRQQARKVTEESEVLLRPFTVLSQLIEKVFQYKGIKLSDPVTLGETRDAIASELLSAGEKQMLSFLCYNAFAYKTCIFIDEPEISLHVDWQRLLFPLLLQQTTGNQFIVATHSPFIYSKYADKELMLAPDRGNDDANTRDDRG